MLSETGRGDGAATHPGVRAGGRLAFVGRRAQLQWLESCLQTAVAGQPRLALIQGDAGIGKSCLLRQLQQTALRQGIAVTAGRCREDLKAPYLAFEALLDLFEPQVRAGPPSGGWAESAGQVSASDTAARIQTVTRSVLKRCGQAPLLACVDDLHWADEASISLLTHLVFAASDAALDAQVSLLVVATLRPELDGAAARAVERLQREPTVETLHLEGLEDAEVHSLVEALGYRRPSQQLVSVVGSATGGNPLFVQETLRHLEREGALTYRGGQVSTTASPRDLGVPVRLAPAIARRVESATPECRELLSVASVVGEAFDLQILVSLAELPEEVVLKQLEDALRFDFVSDEGDRFRFSHALIRRGFLDTLSIARRRRLHLRAAQQLARADDGANSATEVAHHLAEAGPLAPPSELFQAAQRAADRAFALSAPAEAARLYETALAASERMGDLPDRDHAALHFRAGVCHWRTADGGLALDHYEQAADACRRDGDQRGLAEVLRETLRARYTLTSVPYGSEIESTPLEAALADLGDEDPALEGRILATLSDVAWTSRQPERAAELAERALALAEHTSDGALCAEANRGLALARIQQLRVAEAADCYRASLNASRGEGDVWNEGAALQRLPLALLWLGRLDEAQRETQRASELAARTQDWAGHSHTLAVQGLIALARGDFAATSRFCRETMTMVRRSGYPWGGILAVQALACARALQGDWEDSDDAVAAIVEPGYVFEEPGGPIRLMARVYQQLLDAWTDPSDELGNELEAMSRAVDPVNTRDTHALGAFASMVEAADLLSRPEIARNTAAVLRTAYESGLVFTSGWVFLISRVLGVAAWLQDDAERARGDFERALSEARRARARPELARTLLDFARMLASTQAAPDRQRATSLLGEALPLLRELAMRPFLERAEALALELGVNVPLAAPPSDASTAGSVPLTPQDIALLREISRGRTYGEIADEFTLRVQTVQQRAERLFDKLGVSGRTGAAAFALAERLVPWRPAHTPSAETGTAGAGELRVVLVTDLKGFTDMLERVGDLPGRELMRTHNRILRHCLAEHGGHEVAHTGDGVIAAFSDADAAVACAVAMQDSFGRHGREQPELPMLIRIGINAGELLEDEGRLFGAAMNATARICARAAPGEILLSQSARQLLHHGGFELRDRGRVKLKGFNRRFALSQVLPIAGAEGSESR